MLIQKLRQQLDRSELEIVLRALRHSPLIWEVLQDDKILHSIMGGEYCRLSQWSPALIAFKYAGIDGDIFNHPATHLNKPLAEESAAVLEGLLSPTSPYTGNDPLHSGALASAAILERWKFLGEADLSFISSTEENEIWKMIFAILVNYSTYRPHILQNLFCTSDSRCHRLALIAASAQPVPIEEIASWLLPILIELPQLQRVAVMQTASETGPALAKSLAAELLKELPSFESRLTEDPVQAMMTHMERSELLKITGRFNDVLPALDQIKQVTDRLQADLTAQLAQAAARNHDTDTAQQAIERISCLESGLSDGKDMDIILARISTGSLAAIEEGDSASASLSNLLASARLKLDQGLVDDCQGDAIRIFKLLATDSKTRWGLSQEKNSAEFYQTLLSILLEVNLFEEARELAGQAQRTFPNNPDIVQLYAECLEKLGKIEAAIEQRQIALILSGNTPEVHRKLIHTLMSNGDHSEARRETEKLIAQQKSPQTSDYHLLGECFLHTSQLDDAAQACQKGLKSAPEDWALLRLLGVIYRHQDDYELAQKYFSQAILQNPESASIWLELANLHESFGEPEKALEKLLSATNVIPDHPEINLCIGLHHLSQGEQAKGLAGLNQAARFIHPQTDLQLQREIGFHLGKTLYAGGYLEEAIIALEKALTHFPADGALAHLYSQTLISAERYREALPVLLTALDLPEAPFSVHLDYAEVLLRLEMNPEEALLHVRKALEVETETPRGRILIAQAHAAAGQHCEALELFQEALATELAQEPTYFISLTKGIAESALQTEQPHIAITFLREALRNLPDSMDLKRALCNAYIQMDLKPDALRLLNEIHGENGGNLSTLVWIADKAIALSELDLAVETLNQASVMAPDNTEIIVRLGYIQLENGNEKLARETFGQLFQVQEAEPTQLRLAAHALLGLGDISSSIPFIEKALEVSGFESGDLFSELTDLYLQAGQELAALDTIDKHLTIEPDRVNLWQQRSELLEKLGRPKAAIQSLNKALEHAPTEPRLHARIAALYRQDHNLKASLAHIQQAVEQKPITACVARMAAEIFKASMLDQKALDVITQIGEKNNDPEFLLIQADYLLGSDEPDTLNLATVNVQRALEIDVAEPYALALNSIIHHRLGNVQQAIASLENGSESFALRQDRWNRFRKAQILLALGDAAVELRLWSKALTFGREAAVLTPEEPNPSRFIARTLTLQAEFKNILTSVKAVSQSPEAGIFELVARQEFSEMVKSMRKTSPSSDAETAITIWEQRGGYVLLDQPPAESPALTTSEDFRAFIAASSRNGKVVDASLVPEEWLNHTDVKFQLALAYSETDLPNAFQLAMDLADSTPRNPIYQALAAYLADRVKNPAASLGYIQAALAVWPDEPHWRQLAARLEIERENYEAGIDHYEQASLHEPKNAELAFNLGCAYLLGNLPGNAIRVLKQASSIQPLEPDYWAKLAEAHQAVEEYNEAAASIEIAIRLAPERPRYLIIAAGIAADDEALLKSDRLIKKIISLELRENEDILALTELLIKRKKTQKALDFLDGLIALSMTPVPLMLQKAALIKQTRGPEEEISILVSVAKKEPKNPLILTRLSASYEALGKFAEAIQAAEFALKNGEETLSSTQVYELHFRLGVLFQLKGQLDQALDHLTKAIQLSPHQVEAYLEAGKTLQARREFSKALDHLEKAGKIAPNDPRSYLAAGLLMKESKDYHGAENMLRKAAALAPSNPSIKRQLAAVIAMAIIHQNE